MPEASISPTSVTVSRLLLTCPLPQMIDAAIPFLCAMLGLSKSPSGLNLQIGLAEISSKSVCCWGETICSREPLVVSP